MKFDDFTMVTTTGWMTPTAAASRLGYKNVGRTNLYKFLREHKIIIGSSPAPDYANKGYFHIVFKKHRDSYGRIVSSPVLLISDLGLKLIKDLLLEKYPNGYPRKARKSKQNFNWFEQ